MAIGGLGRGPAGSAAAALIATAAFGFVAFFLYRSTLDSGGVDDSEGWSFGPPLNHPWPYGIAVALVLAAAGSLLGGLVGIRPLVRGRSGVRAVNVGTSIAMVGAVALVVAALFQGYLLLLTRTLDVIELLAEKNRFELAYLLAVFAAMTGLVAGMVVTAVGLARAALVSRWPALALALSSLAVAIVSPYLIPAAAAALAWVALDLARRNPA